MSEFSPTPPSQGGPDSKPLGPESVDMRRVFAIATVCCGALMLLWWASGYELRGYSDSLGPGGVAGTGDEGAGSGQAADAESARLMNEGVNLLYQQGKTGEALLAFTAVLDANPEHYGAMYQRARVLDERRQLGEALEAWRLFEPAADAVSDEDPLNHARVRISFLEQRLPELEQMMARAVVLLHREFRPEQALPLFQQVLTDWPTHYGARYQYAEALTEAGYTAEARQAWLTFRSSAEAIGAEADLAAADAALRQIAED